MNNNPQQKATKVATWMSKSEIFWGKNCKIKIHEVVVLDELINSLLKNLVLENSITIK